MNKWGLVVHGGCGAMHRGSLPPDTEQRGLAGMDAALSVGAAVLTRGGTALDAVEASVRSLEEEPTFNAGRGSVLTADGQVSLDAAIMDGCTRRAGAVAGLLTTRAPISLARAVMECTPHVMLAGVGADDFARRVGLEQVANDWFATADRRSQLERLMAEGGAFDANVKFGTVGAVACDLAGNVAAATSTGGLMAKKWGRIGDSPLVGVGTYADNRAAAVSATGHGETFIRAVAAHELTARMRFAERGLRQALDEVLSDIVELGGNGGLIAIAPSGEMAWGFTTPGMYRGRVSEAGREVAVYSDPSRL